MAYAPTYDELVTPAYPGNVAAQPAATDVVLKGMAYKNAQYGFELTFPTDETVYEEAVGSSDMDIRFFPPGSGYNDPDAFSMEITGTYDGQNSLGQIMNSDLQYNPNDAVSEASVGGIPYVEINHALGGARPSFEYVTISHGNIFHFANGGGMALGPFLAILATVQFTLPSSSAADAVPSNQ